MEIKDKKGCDNVIADHLSRVVKTTVSEEEIEVANFHMSSYFSCHSNYLGMLIL